MKLFKIISLCVIVFVSLVSCGDDSDLLSKMIINQPSLEWGASMDEIASSMQQYKLINSDAQNLYYAGNGMEHAISYYFVDGKLETCLVTVSSCVITQDALEALLKSYTFIGEQDNVKIYCKESTKTIAAISKRQTSKAEYYYIGYSKID